MSSRKRCLVTAGLAVASFVFSGVALLLYQVCFVESFWLHVIVFPMNPRTLAQPTALTWLGVASQGMFIVFLLLGMALLLRSAWLLFSHLRRCYN